jgi:hypothetical protein
LCVVLFDNTCIYFTCYVNPEIPMLNIDILHVNLLMFFVYKISYNDFPLWC